MSQKITLARTKPDGSVVESFNADARVDCTSPDGAEESYEIDPGEFLGSGGNAIVYGCKNIGSGESYAIKIQTNTQSERLCRFKREEQLLCSVRHEQLMSCVGFGEIVMTKHRNRERHPFVVMPLAEANLSDLIKSEPASLSFDRLSGQLRGLSEALAVLHKHAIHRDIKPENVLIRGETWMLSDFGLCKFLDPVENGLDVTMENEKIGPVFWMSPESMNRALGRGDEITQASDVFQLASVFWFAATKRHPTGIVKMNDWPGPPEMFEVLEAALSHDPRYRPKDGREFHDRIKSALF